MFEIKYRPGKIVLLKPTKGFTTLKAFLYNLIIFIGISVLFIGCSMSNNPVSGPTNGILQIYMTDTPARYSQVNIAIDSVKVHETTSDSLHGWYILNSTPTTYNLLTLVNGNYAVIGQDTLPPGQYSQIRLYIGTGSNVVINGQSYPLIIPSGILSGLDIIVDEKIEAGYLSNLYIDFDANMSIVVSGTQNNPQYILNPVIRTGTTTTKGIIWGTVSPNNVSSNIWAITGTDTSSTTTDVTGGFQLIYLNPGSYIVYIAPGDTAYKDTTIANISVAASNATNLGTISLTHK
jgi:hypothetical protein